MIDTHTHPYLPEFSNGGADAVSRALAAGVSHMILPNVDADSVVPMKELHARFPQSTSMALGLHPTEVRPGWEQIVASMEESLRAGGFVAAGEGGIDLYWDKTYRELQIEAFKRQISIADSLLLPVIIHCRDGLDEVLGAIRATAPKVRLVFHSFTGSPEDVRRIREVCDPMFGINGVLTFKNAAPLREALKEIGPARLLLETDAPYLAPVPYRGRRNEPAYIMSTLQKAAETLSLPASELERMVDENAKATFGI